MAVSIVDQKILWAKGAGRCSMAGCRKKLVIKTDETKDRQDIIFGENCHIIGEKNDAPRGKSTMPEDERSRYHNLILLCANHHTIIDKAEGEWSVERLHQMKADHELWVESRLDEKNENIEMQLYAKLVNEITDELQLHRWPGISNAAINGQLPVWFVEGCDKVFKKMFSTLWPGAIPEVEQAIKKLEEHLHVFYDVFLSNAELNHTGRLFREMKNYKNEQGYALRNQLREEYTKWDRRKQTALLNFVVSLNEFASAVRKHIDKKYFFFEGQFYVADELGVTNKLVPTDYIPHKYRPLDS
jgi:hypothetical protein